MPDISYRFSHLIFTTTLKINTIIFTINWQRNGYLQKLNNPFRITQQVSGISRTETQALYNSQAWGILFQMVIFQAQGQVD